MDNNILDNDILKSDLELLLRELKVWTTLAYKVYLGSIVGLFLIWFFEKVLPFKMSGVVNKKDVFLIVTFFFFIAGNIFSIVQLYFVSKNIKLESALKENPSFDATVNSLTLFWISFVLVFITLVLSLVIEICIPRF